VRNPRAGCLFSPRGGLGSGNINNFVHESNCGIDGIRDLQRSDGGVAGELEHELIPLPVMPRGTWISASGDARETDNGASGSTMTSDQQGPGLARLANRAGDRSGGCAPTSTLPVHFHHRFQATPAMDFTRNTLGVAGRIREARPTFASAGSMWSSTNARVGSNTVFAASSDAPQRRWCRSRAASAGSRASSRRCDTSCSRTRPRQFEATRQEASEYFRSNWYATFWFEQTPGRRAGPARQRW